LKQSVSQKNGFYFLKSNPLKEPVKTRIERQKIADKKWKKTRKIVRWFQLVPYCRMAAISGSLALGNTREESDLDLLIMSKQGRVWTLRVLLSALTQAMGQRRHGSVINDKICLNQYLTDQFMEIAPKNLSNAQSLARLVPLFGLSEFRRFSEENDWANRFLFFSPEATGNNFRVVKESGF
jgi:predicted nucleotidyltransferase